MGSGKLRWVVCICSLWIVSCGGGGDSPTQPQAGAGGSAAMPDAGSGDRGGGGEGGSPGSEGKGGDGAEQPAQGGTGGAGAGGASQQGSGGTGGAAQGGGGQGGNAGAGGPGDPDTSSLHIDSFAPTGAEAGGVFRYRVVLDQTGPASFELTSAPDGAAIDDNGLITWTPKHNQVGQSHDFTVKAALGGDETTQDFSVAVTALTISAEQLLDPNSELLQVISVDSPLSNAVGVTLTVPPGALSAASSLSIATTSGAPPMPAQSNAGDTPIVLGFGPSGSVFNSPIDLVVPLSSTAIARLSQGQGIATAWTLGSDGRWEPLPIEYVDLESGYVQIKLQHFSLVGVMAAPALITLDQTRHGAAGCPGTLFVHAGFTAAALSTITTNWLNGAALGSGLFEVESALKGLLTMLPAGHSVQLMLRAVLSAAAGGSEERQYQLFTLQKRADGHIDLTVTNGGGNVLHRRSDLTPEDAQIDAILHGDFTHFVFREFPAMQDGRIAIDAFAYARRPDAPAITPGSEGQAFASLVQTFEQGTLSEGAYDDDCDGTVNSADDAVTTALPPRVYRSAETTLRTSVNTPVSLGVRVQSDTQGGAKVSWTSSSPAAVLTPEADGLQASFVSAMPGAFKVTATAQDSAGSTAETFLIVVDSPVAPNTPPRCKIHARQTSVFTGDQIPLEAVLEDAEQPNQELSVEWSVAAGAALSGRSERRVSFGAQAPAVYEVTCVARDGSSSSQPTSLSITVFDRPQNSPPRLSFVAPASATLQIGNNGLASQQIRVSAIDLDRDPVAIEFTLLEGSASLAVVDAPSGVAGVTNAARNFETATPGPYSVLVRAVDQNNATSESVVIKLLVAQSIDRTDADQDRFPASVDCNDNDVSVYPGAPEVCGDGIDQNCNGSDKATADCDADRDGRTANDGDCDDTNPTIFPGAFERCNGRDDNCNGTIDEGYVVGTACTLGLGACAVTGMTVCSSTGGASVCTAKPSAPVAETCNGIDDNCNGRVDDVPAQGAADVQNCGGCGSVCSAGAHQVAACTQNSAGTLGCSFSCSQGYIDLDRNPQNGCEYTCSKASKEACNSLDDDCDGLVDEQTDAPVYTGPAGTLGVGECRSGLMVCRQGVLVQVVAPITPTKERCDMRDNNCDGKVDDGYQLGGSCDGPDPDLCAYGRLLCSPEGGVICGIEPSANTREICDGQDNDCNPETVDGSADRALNTPCDAANREFCEPGHVTCTSGRLLCSNEMRDRLSCKVCECDTTSTCDTNGAGFFCTCDPQCNGPDVGCGCDVASGCDLVDDAEECGCDKECTGETACSCNVLEKQCDTAEGGFACACDDACGGTCGCDSAANSCDKTPNGDACLCDRDCYPSCSCDDRDPNTCAKDSSGHPCQCDPTCQSGGSACECDLTQRTCDRDVKSGTVCACDLDCGASTCSCNSTSGCDKASNGDACLCDRDCYAPCPCDDRVDETCARDANGNACQCDPTCLRGGGPSCSCDSMPGACDKDQAGNACSCDADCRTEPPSCECDKSSGMCELDSQGKPCACDRDCGSTSTCACDAQPGSCDKAPNGDNCLCDSQCYAMCPCADDDPQLCKLDSDGHACSCDPGCERVQPTACTCDTTQSCDTAKSGDACLCDASCYPSCACDDKDPNVCARDSAGNACRCDPTCQGGAGPTCECDKMKGVCEKSPSGATCSCDADCTTSTPCGCDLMRGVCEKDPNGNPCGCDADCAAPPSCECDKMKGVCEKSPSGASCSCDVDCAAPPSCGCDLMKGVCEKDPNGNPCGCDVDCSAPPSCGCDLMRGVCEKDPNGNPCGCDVDCAAPPSCECDKMKGVCEKSPSGASCSCDVDCSASTPCGCDLMKGVCEKDPNGNPCGCDVDCSAPKP